ncbi:TIGR00645 family protein [Brevundimonas sp. GCM10030266]|uniref:TIGR00645 family protein n=1 Tax=Brevundimonas sp. GCM10030266 TaxID=3273386 RepID=UPI003613D184
MGLKPKIETGFERLLFQSRWLMAPFYAGLALALLMLLVVFLRDLFYYVPKAFMMVPGAALSSNDAILAVLTLVDLSLAGNLLLIVMFSGYENFVSKLDLEGEQDRPPWMGTVDFSGLKMKLIASIVAISGIQLLKFFMNIGKDGAPIDTQEAMWGVIIHLTFVISGVLLALMDWLTSKTDKH